MTKIITSNDLIAQEGRIGRKLCKLTILFWAQKLDLSNCSQCGLYLFQHQTDTEPTVPFAKCTQTTLLSLQSRYQQHEDSTFDCIWKLSCTNDVRRTGAWCLLCKADRYKECQKKTLFSQLWPYQQHQNSTLTSLWKQHLPHSYHVTKIKWHTRSWCVFASTVPPWQDHTVQDDDEYAMKPDLMSFDWP